MTVELLYFDGCPGYAALWPRLEQLLAERGLLEELELLPVMTLEQALRQRFLGSPSLRVNGRDVEPAAEGRSDYGMKCRLYAIAEGRAHAPSDELILAALERPS